MTDSSSPQGSEAPASGPAADSLTKAIAARRDRDDLGHGQFQVVDDAQIHCLTCGKQFPGDQVDADDIDRLEGASDPADLSMVVPVHCPHCDTSGPLIVRYGPEASAQEADLLVALRRSPAERGRS